jgi:hypothetical protein
VKAPICWKSAVEMTCLILASYFGIEIVADGGDLAKLKLGEAQTSPAFRRTVARRESLCEGYIVVHGCACATLTQACQVVMFQLPAFARELVRAQVAGDESDSYLKASLRRTYRYRDLRP